MISYEEMLQNLEEVAKSKSYDGSVICLRDKTTGDPQFIECVGGDCVQYDESRYEWIGTAFLRSGEVSISWNWGE